MNSMTGFGKAEVKSKVGKFTVEISSVNNRFLELTPRMPRQFSVLEPKVRELITALVSRGKVNLYVGYDEAVESSSKSFINENVSKAFYKQLKEIKNDLKLAGDITIADLLVHPEVTKPAANGIDDKVIWEPLKKTLEKAVKDFVGMRKKEGDALAKDMKKRLAIMTKEVKVIEKQSCTAVKKYRDRLNKRLDDLLNSPLQDKVRVEEEIALLAERTDITEECTRFSSHLDQYKMTIDKKEPVGKKLNFILQELNREANTIASKCSDIEISANVITLKEEIEKLREQVQNIE